MTVDELFAAAAILARGQRTKGNKLAIVTNGGGPGVLAVDRCSDLGIPLSELSIDTLKTLDAALPSFWSHTNPVDILGEAAPSATASRCRPASRTRTSTARSCCSPRRR